MPSTFLLKALASLGTSEPLVLSDNFNRANGASGWTAGGLFQLIITNNVAAFDGNGGGVAYKPLTAAAPNIQDMSATITSIASGRVSMKVFQEVAAGGGPFGSIETVILNGVVTIRHINNDGTLASESASLGTIAQGTRRLRLRSVLTGSSATSTVYSDGVAVGTYTAAVPTFTRQPVVGLYADTTTPTFDDVLVYGN